MPYDEETIELMSYDEESLNIIHDTPMTGRLNMSADGTIYAIDAIRGLREIVAATGPATTRECKYAEYVGSDPYGQEPVAPHCIVGVFLNKRGVDLEALAALEGDSVMGAANDALVAEKVTLDEQAVDVLWAAQSLQDDGYNWGQALEAAEAVFQAQKAGGRYVANHVIEDVRLRFRIERDGEAPEPDVNDTTGYGDVNYDPYND